MHQGTQITIHYMQYASTDIGGRNHAVKTHQWQSKSPLPMNSRSSDVVGT
jgi:hypothetical protein